MEMKPFPTFSRVLVGFGRIPTVGYRRRKRNDLENSTVVGPTVGTVDGITPKVSELRLVQIRIPTIIGSESFAGKLIHRQMSFCSNNKE